MPQCQEKLGNDRPILFVSASEENERTFRLYVGTQHALASVHQIAEARLTIRECRPRLVVCDTDVGGRDSWRDLLDPFDPAGFVLNVVSKHADDRLWAEVLSLGGYDVLAAPLQQHEVLNVISAGLRKAGAIEQSGLGTQRASRAAG